MNPNESYNCIILDDELNCVEVLAYEIGKVKPDLKIVQSFTRPEEALAYLKTNSVDIIFLDIEMPRMNAFQFLEQLESLPTNIIFTTAYDHYAIKAFRYYAIDYLLKPIERELLAQAIDRAYDRQRRLDKNIIKEIHNKIQAPNSVFTKIAVPVEQGFQMIAIENIVRCEASSNYALIYRLNEKPILISKPLKYLDRLLDNHGFFRTHQSHLINVNFIAAYSRLDGGVVSLTNGDKIKVSKSRKQEFESFLTSFTG